MFEASQPKSCGGLRGCAGRGEQLPMLLTKRSRCSLLHMESFLQVLFFALALKINETCWYDCELTVLETFRVIRWKRGCCWRGERATMYRLIYGILVRFEDGPVNVVMCSCDSCRSSVVKATARVRVCIWNWGNMYGQKQVKREGILEQGLPQPIRAFDRRAKAVLRWTTGACCATSLRSDWLDSRMFST